MIHDPLPDDGFADRLDRRFQKVSASHRTSLMLLRNAGYTLSKSSDDLKSLSQHTNGKQETDADSDAQDTADDELDACLSCLGLIERVRQRQLLRTSLAARMMPGPMNLPKRIGRFHIEREIGQGGGGIVLLATDPGLRRHVALKIPHPQLLTSDSLQRRFIREAEATARLDHPHIIRVFEAGSDGPFSYLASEYCEGPTLHDWRVAQPGPIPFSTAAAIVRDLAEAVEHAHAQAVIHRDIKPGNVLIVGSTRDHAVPTVKLCDFGLAKVLEEEQEHTRTGSLLGTPAYMSPEQAEGRLRDVDVRTDVYSLGVLLFELLTGSPPFKGETRAAILLRVTQDEPPNVRSLRKDTPLDLAVIVSKCLSKSKGDRYASAKELAEDLSRYLEGQPIAARPLPWWERLNKWMRRRPATALAAALGVLLPISVLAVALTSAVVIFKQNREIMRRLYVADMGSAKQAIDDHRFDEAREILRRYEPSFGRNDVRTAAWRFLNAQVPDATATEWKYHDEDIYSIAISPDEKLLATASRDGTACVWKLGTTTLVHRLVGHEGDVNEVRFSPDGSLIATCGDDGTIRLWDTATGAQRHAIKAHANEIGCIVFTADGSAIFSGGKDNAVRLWDVETGGLTDTVWEGGKSIYALAIGQNGSLIIASRTSPLVCVDLKSKSIKWTLAPGEDDRRSVYSLCYAPTSDQLIVGGWDAHRILNASSGEVISANVRNLGGGSSSAVAISTNGVDVVLANGSGALETRLLGSDTPPRSLYSSRARIWGVAFLGSDEILFSTADGMVRRVSIGQHADSAMRTLTRIDGAVDSLVVNDSGDTLYAIGGKSLVAIDPNSGGIKRSKRDFDDGVWALDYREEEDLLVTGHEFGRVKFWRASTFEWVAEAPTIVPSQHEPDEEVECIAFVPGKSCVLYATDSNRLLRMYDYKSQSFKWEMAQSNGKLNDIAFMQANGHFAAGFARGLDVYAPEGDGYKAWAREELIGRTTVAVEAIPSETASRFLSGHRSGIGVHHGHDGNERGGGASFSRSNIQVIAIDRKGQQFLVCGTQGEICRLRENKLGLYVEQGSLLDGVQVSAAVFNADGSAVYCGLTDGRIVSCPVDPSSSDEFLDPTDKFKSAAVSPNLDFIAVTAENSRTRLMRTNPLRRIAPNDTDTMTFSVDGSRLYAARSEALLEINQRETGDGLSSLGHARNTVGTLIALAGDKLLVLDKDGSIYVIDPHDRSKDAVLWNDAIAPTERAAVSAAGDLIASATTDKSIRVWSSETLDVVAEIQTSDFTRALAFSPDASELAVGTINGIVETYDLASGEVRARLRQSQNVVIHAMAYLDPTTLLVFPDLGDLQAWDIVAESLLYTIDAGLFGSVNDIDIVPEANAFVLVGTDMRGRGLLRIHRLESVSTKD